MGNSGVRFGGVDMADASPYLQIIDVIIGSVERNLSTLNPPLADGLLFGSLKNASRPISITLDIRDSNPATRFEAIRRLNMILASKVPLEFEAPCLGDRYINAICTALPSASMLEWAGELAVQLQAPDPFIYSRADDLNETLTAAGSIPFYIDCSGEVRPVITQVIAATITGPVWECSNGQSIMLLGDVVAGTLVIDCIKRQITHTADADIMAKLSSDSLFFGFAPNPVGNYAPYTMTCSSGAAGKMVGKYRWI